MEAGGYTRKVDELGRVVLPKELRQYLDIEAQDMVEVTADEDRIILTKSVPRCVFCGGQSGLVKHMSKYICAQCVQAVVND